MTLLILVILEAARGAACIGVREPVGQVRVSTEPTAVPLEDNTLVLDSPKTAAGIRTVHIPPHLSTSWGTPRRLPRSRWRAVAGLHKRPRRATRKRRLRSTWVTARERVGLSAFRFHDPRHSGNTPAAATGAGTKELMAKMGHASMRAALIYQHASADRDAAIAVALSRLAAGEAVPWLGLHGHVLRAEGRVRARGADG